MARRPSSRSSSGRAPARKPATPSHEVHCPDCGTNYQVPETKLDAKVQCRRCGRVFTPINILRKSQRRTKGPSGPSAAMVSSIIAVAAVIIFAVIFSQSLQDDPPPRSSKETDTPSGPSLEELRLMKQPGVDLEKWIAAVMDRDSRALERLTHLESFYLTYPEKERPKDRKNRVLPWAEVDPVEKIDWRKRIFTDLTQGDLHAPFEGKQYVNGTCHAAGGARDPLLKKELKAKASFRKGKDQRDVYELSFDLKNMGSAKKPKWQVASVAVTKTPKPPKQRKKRKKVPKGMEASKLTKEVTKEGKVIHKYPVVPLGHLDDTPQKLRDEIDGLIAILADPAKGREVGAAARKLIDIGRPAFPRLLNLFYEIDKSDDPNSYESITTLVRLIKFVIIPMTDCDYGYDPSPTGGGSPEAAAAKRKSALEQYYAWWARHSTKAYWKALKEKLNAPIDEDL